MPNIEQKKKKEKERKEELTIACYQVTPCCLLLQNMSLDAGGGDLGHREGTCTSPGGLE